MSVYRCKVCGDTFPNFGAVGLHKKQVHPTGAPVAPKVRATPGRRARRIEDIAGPPVDTPSPGDPALPSTGSEGGDAGRGGEDGPAPLRTRPVVESSTIRITPEARVASTREAIRDALPLAVLADILRGLTRALSEADGAGEAGVLSEIQATQVAYLLHDATVDLVATRFAGDVTTFKAAMAVVLILIAKGGVHARAIRAKVEARRALAASSADAAAALAAAAPDDPVARAMALQNVSGMSPEDAARWNAG